METIFSRIKLIKNKSIRDKFMRCSFNSLCKNIKYEHNGKYGVYYITPQGHVLTTDQVLDLIFEVQGV